MSSDNPFELEARDLGLTLRGRRADPFEALKGVSCTLRPGERVALLGANGSGKTTLLRTLAGLYAPTAGCVRSTGQVIGLFDHTLGLHASVTGWENAVMLGLLHGYARHEIEAARAAIVEFSGLKDWMDRPIRGWSAGMMLRLAFSVALMRKPRILLMDEVLTVADAEFLSKALALLTSPGAGPSAMVFAAHDLGLVRALAHRAVILQNGAVAFDGPVEAAVDRYAGGRGMVS